MPPCPGGQGAGREGVPGFCMSEASPDPPPPGECRSGACLGEEGHARVCKPPNGPVRCCHSHYEVQKGRDLLGPPMLASDRAGVEREIFQVHCLPTVWRMRWRCLPPRNEKVLYRWQQKSLMEKSEKADGRCVEREGVWEPPPAAFLGTLPGTCSWPGQIHPLQRSQQFIFLFPFLPSFLSFIQDFI